MVSSVVGLQVKRPFYLSRSFSLLCLVHRADLRESVDLIVDSHAQCGYALHTADPLKLLPSAAYRLVL